MLIYAFEFNESTCDSYVQRISVAHTSEPQAKEVALTLMERLGWPKEKRDELKLVSSEEVKIGILTSNVEKY